MCLASSEVERRGHKPRDGGSLWLLERQDAALGIRVRPLAFLHFLKITESIMSFVSCDFFFADKETKSQRDPHRGQGSAMLGLGVGVGADRR